MNVNKLIVSPIVGKTKTYYNLPSEQAGPIIKKSLFEPNFMYINDFHSKQTKLSNPFSLKINPKEYKTANSIYDLPAVVGEYLFDGYNIRELFGIPLLNITKTK